MSTPYVSVLMPTYERTQYLREALDSLFAQTYTDFIVLIGDNSESDNVQEVIETYDDDRIRYHRNRPGLGAQGNWIDLVKRAQTPLVATLHDDDVWTPEFLASTMPVMVDNSDIAMLFTDFWLLDSESRLLTDMTNVESKRTKRSEIEAGYFDYSIAEGLRLVAVWNSPQPAYAAVLRRDEVLACEFPDEIAPLYDIWLSYQLVKRGKTLFYNPDRLTQYRWHPGSITGGTLSVAEDTLFSKIVAENSDAGPVLKEIKKYWATLRWGRATRLMIAQGGKHLSQKELTAASSDLNGMKRIAAFLAGRSELLWVGLQMMKKFITRVRRQRVTRYRL